MKKFFCGLGIAFAAILIIGLPIFFGATPAGKTIWNNWFHSVQEADDKSNYAIKKEVEDTCRAMIASYNSDKLVYEQYKDSSIAEEVSWANNAKIRANQTASTYNNYILKNSYVWQDNVPSDIYLVLAYLQ